MTHACALRAFCLCVPLSVAGVALAQDESFCAEPGLTLLTDAAGDVDFQLLPAGLPLDPYDVQSLKVAQPLQDDGIARIVFTLKVASLAELLPRQAWFATFQSEDQQTYGVRMVVAEDGTASFESYRVLVDTDGNVTEGRYPETGGTRPALPESGYDADGTIRIVVEASKIGLRKPGLLSGFNAASLQQIPTGDVLTPSGDLLALVGDGMPDDMSRSGEVATSENGDCGQGKSGFAQAFGGALGWGGLLGLLALSRLRRQT